MLKERGMLELSFEALVVARAEHFPSNVVAVHREEGQWLHSRNEK